MNALIQRYLAAPARKAAILDEMDKRPRGAFKAILAFRGPYPRGMHPIDAHADFLTDLLAGLLRRHPELVLGPRPARYSPGDYTLISAAISVGNPRFAGLILGGFKDPSLYVKILVADGVIRRKFLRTPETRVELRRLLKMKSIRDDPFSRGIFRKALARR
ncbi:MAG: hypothetical protein ABI584_05510 [Acidobacteriota bacterium]